MNQHDYLGGEYKQPWYVVRCRANAERAVASGLTNRGVNVFLPFEKRPSKRKNIGYIETPLFPGYVFAQFEYRSALLVVACPGVVHILCRGQIPEAVDSGEMHSLLSLSRQSVEMSSHPTYFVKGDKVRITHGPLVNIEGIVAEDNGSQKLILSVSMLRRSVVAHVDRELIESLTAAPAAREVTVWAATGV
jgi:transcription antitermination factor NusG